MIKKIIIVIVGVLLLSVATFGVIEFLRAHQVVGATAWANRLRLIESAKAQWALNYDKTSNNVPTWSDISVYCPSDVFSNVSVANGKLIGPKGEIYTIGRVGESPSCSIDGKTLTLP
jgi:hypothetical protein